MMYLRELYTFNSYAVSHPRPNPYTVHVYVLYVRAVLGVRAACGAVVGSSLHPPLASHTTRFSQGNI